MSDDVIKSVIIRDNFEKLMASFKSNKLIRDFEMRFQFLVNEFFDDDIVDLVMMEYYVKNRNCSNNTINIIKNKYKNKDYLHDRFYRDEVFALDLIRDAFSIDFNSPYRRNNFSTLSDNERMVARSLSKTADIIDCKYISFYARLTLLKYHLSNKYPEEDRLIVDYMVNDIEILKRFILSDAYTYTRYFDVDFLDDVCYNVIRDYCSDYRKVWSVLENVDCVGLCYKKSVEAFLEFDDYSKIYSDLSKKDPGFLNVIKSVNPFVVVDDIESFSKTYRK